MIVTGTRETITLKAAAFIAGRILGTVKSRGFCSLVLPGGNSPRPLFHLLASGIPAGLFGQNGSAAGGGSQENVTIPWDAVSLFWGDERCVPDNHPDSNFRMARESLLDRISSGFPEVHPMPQVVSGYDKAAAAYETTLRNHFATRGLALREGFPVFDIVLLGMGADGHTASLFPSDHIALGEKKRWVIAVDAQKGSPPGHRLSLTLPVINNAETVVFFVTGREKEPLLRDIALQKRPELPAGMVRPVNGEAVWFYAP